MKNLKLAAVCLSCLTMTGCSALNFSVEGLINAPKLTSEQSEIHQALIESVGSNITLKYPKNGEYRSAYVIANIDDEPTDEAMVFYEYTSNGSEEDGLRVNILDKDEDGKWYSVKELAGAGTDIDQVIISPMGSNNQTDVFVGYQNLTNDEKTMEIYSYTDGDFKRVALDTYSVLEPLDINNDGYIELITIQRSTNNDTGAVTAKASMLNMKNNEITRGENVDMCDNVTSYVSSKTGMLDSGRRAIFIDGLTADRKIADGDNILQIFRGFKILCSLEAKSCCLYAQDQQATTVRTWTATEMWRYRQLRLWWVMKTLWQTKCSI